MNTGSSIRKKMGRSVTAAVFAVFFLFSAGAMADIPRFDEDIAIAAIWSDGTDFFIYFSELPEGCTGEYQKAHAVLRGSQPDQQKLINQLSTAKAMMKTVDIWFNDFGSCTSLNSLIEITKVRVN